jgi:hypothetical protein
MIPDGARLRLQAGCTSFRSRTEEQPMLSAAIDLWLLPATMFFDAFLPAPKPATAIIMPLTSTAQRIRRKRKIVRSKRGD